MLADTRFHFTALSLETDLHSSRRREDKEEIMEDFSTMSSIISIFRTIY